MKDGLAFHREISTTNLSREERQLSFQASETECREIAAFLGISALQSLSATLTVRRWRRQGVALEGILHAKAVQECVVTLAPVEEEIDEPISLRFELRDSRQRTPRAAADTEIFVDPEAADPPESAQVARQMAAGGQQQVSGVEQIAMAMQNINQAMVHNLASTRQTETAASDLNDLARSLTETVAQYRL